MNMNCVTVSNGGCGETDMRTAIEPEPPISRWRQGVLHIRNSSIMSGLLSEQLLLIYLFLHWMLSYSFKNFLKDEDASYLLTLFYFLAIVFAFFSIMSNLNCFMYPFICACSVICTFLFIVFLTALFSSYMTKPFEFPLCFKSAADCESFNDRTKVILLSGGLILFYNLTLLAAAEQFARNAEQIALLRAMPPNAPFYPQYGAMRHAHPTTRFVDSVNIDEPPRYSTIEKAAQTPENVQSLRTETSPPRYSYWERTFGPAMRTAVSSPA